MEYYSIHQIIIHDRQKYSRVTYHTMRPNNFNKYVGKTYLNNKGKIKNCDPKISMQVNKILTLTEFSVIFMRA